MTGPPLVVFTDLDGTLLRHEDYDWSPAAPALAELRRRGIPLVIASSKTRSEIEAWRVRLDNHAPFISENGGALYVPRGTTPEIPAGASPAQGYDCVRFGTDYARLRAALHRLSGELGILLRGFGDMDARELEQRTGLAGADLELARQREFDEPFVPVRPLAAAEEGRLNSLASACGLRVTRGGRFHHLVGPNSKGAAAKRLLSAYAAGGAPVPSLGIGDGANDLELLQAVDRAVVVARPDGTHAPELREALPGAMFTREAGPLGFRAGVLASLSPVG